MGRPKKPTELKRYEGNPGKGKLEDDDFMPDGVPLKPKGLDAAASWLWDLVVDPMVAQQVATEIDTAALIGMCCWWSRYKSLEDGMAESGVPEYRELAMATMAWKQFMMAASKFGLTPSDRAGLRIGSGKTKESPLEQFLTPHVPCRN